MWFGTETFYTVASMILSQASKSKADPLSDVFTVLGAEVSRCMRLEAAGEWALSFPALDRLKFVGMLRGFAWLTVNGRDPLLMEAGDICLIGRTAYAVASDPELPVTDGRSLYETGDVARLGGDETAVLGGTVTFSTSGILPPGAHPHATLHRAAAEAWRSGLARPAAVRSGSR